MKISEDQIKAAYQVAKRVYAGEISRAAGTRELVRDYGLNHSSAADTISNVRYLLRGERYADKQQVRNGLFPSDDSSGLWSGGARQSGWCR